MKKEQQAALVLIGLGITVVGTATNYARVIRVEHKKRKLIKAWEQTNHACVENVKTRLAAALVDDSVSISEFWAMYHEEMKFLTIVHNQPMY